ncbi:MAG: hypothetical protein E4G74_00815 [Erysipelotrichales bacterium]|nr:MAG: hypothetical protein E4G74_00815 [Erysipelotrichales bacterium]
MKHEWRKAEKAVYLPQGHPEMISIPTYNYISIHGKGNPNSADFQHRVETLFGLAYGIKMAPRKGIVINNYVDYTVYPLEGIWDYSPEAIEHGLRDKEHLVYTLMIRQPSFINEKLFNQVVTLKKFSDPDDFLDLVEFIEHTDGLCVQMMHVGSFDNEPASFAKIEEFIEQHHLTREDKRHREIYLSDFRTTAVAKLQTVLRVFVKPHQE